MSTITEVIAAREEGLEIMVLSLVMNMVVILEKYRSIRDEVEAEGREIRSTFNITAEKYLGYSSLAEPWLCLRLKLLLTMRYSL